MASLKFILFSRLELAPSMGLSSWQMSVGVEILAAGGVWKWELGSFQGLHSFLLFLGELVVFFCVKESSMGRGAWFLVLVPLDLVGRGLWWKLSERLAGRHWIVVIWREQGVLRIESSGRGGENG
jgi:hypothetical protein